MQANGPNESVRCREAYSPTRVEDLTLSRHPRTNTPDPGQGSPHDAQHTPQARPRRQHRIAVALTTAGLAIGPPAAGYGEAVIEPVETDLAGKDWVSARATSNGPTPPWALDGDDVHRLAARRRRRRAPTTGSGTRPSPSISAARTTGCTRSRWCSPTRRLRATSSRPRPTASAGRPSPTTGTAAAARRAPRRWSREGALPAGPVHPARPGANGVAELRASTTCATT